MGKKKGFTLIELLVVLAVISILAAILFPVIKNAKDKAKHSVCVSNAKQIAYAFMLYTSDHEEYTLPLFYLSPKYGRITIYQFIYWPKCLVSYVQSPEIYFCPKDEKEDPALVNSEFLRKEKQNPQYEYNWSFSPSYGYNGRYLSPGLNEKDPDAGPFTTVPLSAFASPATTIAFAESTWFSPRAEGSKQWAEDVGYYRVYPPSKWMGAPPANGLSWGHFWPRHYGFGTVIFLDTHVKSHTPTQLQDENMWNGKGQAD